MAPDCADQAFCDTTTHLEVEVMLVECVPGALGPHGKFALKHHILQVCACVFLRIRADILGVVEVVEPGAHVWLAEAVRVKFEFGDFVVLISVGLAERIVGQALELCL